MSWCELLVGAGHEVQVIQTPESRRFVGPTTFAALSRRPVLTDDGGEVFPHLDASGQAELLCIAPLTATTMARLAHGEAANVLTATALAFAGPGRGSTGDESPHVVGDRHPGECSRRCGERGVELVGPTHGDTAEGEIGIGRMAEPDQIAVVVGNRLEAGSSLAGKRAGRHRGRHPRAARRGALPG